MMSHLPQRGELPTPFPMASLLNQNILFNTHVHVPTATFVSFDILCKACRFICSSIVVPSL